MTNEAGSVLCRRACRGHGRGALGFGERVAEVETAPVVEGDGAEAASGGKGPEGEAAFGGGIAEAGHSTASTPAERGASTRVAVAVASDAAAGGCDLGEGPVDGGMATAKEQVRDA